MPLSIPSPMFCRRVTRACGGGPWASYSSCSGRLHRFRKEAGTKVLTASGPACQPGVHLGGDAQLQDGCHREGGKDAHKDRYYDFLGKVINGCISQTNQDVRDHVILYTRILQVQITISKGFIQL